MKRFNLVAFVLTLCLSACHGVSPDDDTNVVPGPETEVDNLVGNITLYADKDIIKADGSYTSTLTVLLMDNHGVEHDVTSKVDIYVEGEDTPISDPDFKTKTEGVYTFYAVRGFDISNSVTVRAVNGVPDLPADPEAGNLSFKHRFLLVQHTGNECPNCPQLMDILKRLSQNDDYASRYHHVASHSYNTSDAAFSSAAQTLSKTVNLTRNYPMLTYNLTTEDGFFEDDIKEAIISLSKESADASIAASAALVGNTVYANVSIKSAIDSKYRVAVWLLEDNIHSPQSGATASWHNMHSNCLREMAGNDKNECIYGKSIGLVNAGSTQDVIAAIELDPEWITDNCKLMIIAVAGNGDYDVVNCTYCPINGSVSYDYL